MVETGQLQTLVAVAKCQSFSKAAEELGVTQSAISQSVKALEKKLSAKLFKRSGKKVMLTGEGEKLYRLGVHFLSQLDETVSEIKFDRDAMKGTVRLGTLMGVGKSWMAPTLLEFNLENPEISLRFNLGFQDDLLDDFVNYRLDLLVVPEDCLPKVGTKIFLGEEKSLLVLPKSGLEVSNEITLEELSALPTILFEERDPLYLNWCKKVFGRAPKDIFGKLIINSHGNMLAGVRQGLGVSVVPKHVFLRSHNREYLKTLGPEFEVNNGRFYLVYHEESYQLKRVRETIEALISNTGPFQ